MKRILALLLALVMLVGAVPVTHATEIEIPTEEPVVTEVSEPVTEETDPVTEATEPVTEETEPVPDAEAQTVDLDSGYIGDLYWNVTDEGVLTITGTGAIPDYEDGGTPWDDYTDDIYHLKLGEGITRIGNRAFSGMPIESDVVIPDSVTELGDYVFLFSGIGAYNKKEAPLMTVELGSGVKTLGENVFSEAYLKALTVNSRNPYWTVKDGVLYTSDYRELYCYVNGPADFRVPDTVQRIHSDAFAASAVQTVAMGDSVMTLGAGAFDACSNLTQVKLSNSLQEIPGRCFSETKIRSITIPDSVTRIGGSAFSICESLVEVVLHDGITAIDSYAFYGSALESIELPAGLETIGECAFKCDNLKTVEFSGTALKTIGDDAFHGTSLSSVTLPAGLESMGDRIFGDDVFSPCENLKSIKFLGNAPTLVEPGGWKDGTFAGVTATVYYPANDSSWNDVKDKNYGGTLTWEAYEKEEKPDDGMIASGTIGGLNWKVTADGILEITGNGAILDYESPEFGVGAPWSAYRDKITELKLGEGITRIGSHAFSMLGIGSAVIPDSVTAMGEHTFDNCYALTNVKLSNNLTAIPESCFYWSALESIEIPDSVTRIEVGAFNCCGRLGEVTLPDTITYIGDNAFRSTAISEITFPASLTTLGNSVFYDCGEMTVKFLGDAPAMVKNTEPGDDWRSGTFAGVTAKILYPAGNATWDAVVGGNYGGTLTWEAYTIPIEQGDNYIYTVENGQVTIDKYLGSDTEVTVPAAIERMPVTAIGDQAFAYCYALEKVNLPDTLRSIGTAAFQNCEALQEVHIPAGVKRIENDTFLNCYQLEKVTLPAGLTYIGDYAFGYCEMLTDITIPGTVTHIGNYAFRGCKALTAITLPAGLTGISEGAFSLCRSLTRIVIPEGVTAIGPEAFFQCRSLGSVTLPLSVTAVEKQAFSQCDDLRCISYAGSAAQKEAISTASGNTPLKNANWHLNGTYCKVVLSSVTAHASGQPELSWPDLACMQSFDIYRSTSSKGTYTLLDTVTGTGYVDESAQLGKKYYYYLVGINNEGEATEKTASKSGYCRLAQPVITADNPNRIPVISWEKVEKATKYEIWRAETAHDTFKKVTTTSKLSYTDTKAPKGEMSYYKVRALGSSSNITSNYSNIEGTGYVVAQPAAKLTLTSAGLPSLSWSKVTGVTFYEVYRGLSADGPFQCLVNQKSTSFVDSTAPADTECFYYVLAIAPGEGCSSTSDILSVATACPTPTASAAPDSASGLPVISWKTVEGAATYEISRATKSSGSYIPVGTTAELTFTDETAEGGKTYYYKVTAVTPKGTRSNPSSYKSCKCVCAAPVFGTGVESATGKPYLTWVGVSGGKKYEVYRATSETGKYSKIATVSKATSGTWYTYVDAKASAGKTYYYKVKAIAASSAYNSGYTEIWAAPCYCAHPQVKVTVHAATGQPELSWGKVSGAVKYEIHRAVSEDGPYTRVRTQTATTFRDTAAVTDTAYFYQVIAVASDTTYNSVAVPSVSVTAACAQPVITGAESHKYLGYPILSWKTVESAAAYEISRATKSSGTYEVIGTATELTFSDETAAGGKTWYYKVTALTESGAKSAPSAYKSAKSVCAMPMVVPGVNPEGKPTLEWDAVSGAKKYEIYRTTDPTKKYTKIATVTKLSYVDSKAPAAATCHYKVRALASSSSYNSVYAEYIFAPSLCARPKLTVKLNTKTGMPEVSWSKVTGAIGYKILRAMGDGEYQELTEVTGTSFKDTAAPVDTVISYKLVALAKNPVYNSYESDPKSVTIAVGKPTITTAAADEATGKPRLTWEPVDGAVSYEIRRSTKSKSGYTAIGTTEELTYVDTTAAVGKTYYYKLVALGVNTRSVESAYKSVKCQLVAPVLSLVRTDTGNVTISWDPVGDFEDMELGYLQYEVYRSEKKDSGFTKLRTTMATSCFNMLPDVDTVYYYKVRAVTQDGIYSPYSAVISTLQVRLELDQTTLELESQKRYELSGFYGGLENLYWSSSDTEVAVVRDGTVIGRKPGTTIITVTDKNVSATCTVTVVTPQLKPLQFLTASETVVCQGDSYQLEYHYEGDGELTWTSTDPAVLTVSDTGVVTGVAVGTAMVVVTDGTHRAQIKIHIKDAAHKIHDFYIWSDHFLYDGVTKFKGDWLQVKVRTRSDGTPEMHDITFSSSDQGIVSVEWDREQLLYADGGSTWLMLHFNHPGTATVTITSEDRGFSQTYTFHVKETYDCDPGKEKLTPEEFAYYATQVGVEMGHKKTEKNGTYRYVWYDEKNLTWEKAVALGRGTAHEYYSGDGYEYILISYQGWDDSMQKHLFFHGF